MMRNSYGNSFNIKIIKNEPQMHHTIALYYVLIMLNQPIINSDSQVTDTQYDEENMRRPLLQRMFGKLGEGSLRSAIFTMMASAMGTGLFNFPYLAQQTGLIMVVAYIMIGGIFSLVSMYLLMSIALPLHIKTYNQLAEYAYGKWMKRLSEVCIILYAWGITVCFQVVFAKFVVQIAGDLFNLKIYVENTTEFSATGNLIRIIANVANISINMLFVLQKDLYSLRFVTILGVASVIYNMTVILVTAFSGFTYTNQTPHFEIYSVFSPKHEYGGLRLFNFDNPLKQMIAIASTVFCYVNHQMIFPLALELKNPTLKRLHKIFNRAHVAEGIIYSIVGVMGYLLISQITFKGLVLEQITTTPMLVGKCLMLITLFFAVPLNLLPSREMLFNSLELTRNKRNHIIVCFALALSGCGVALTFQKVTSYFGLLGGTAGTLMSGTIPALIYIKKTERKLTDIRCIFIIVFYSIMTVCGFTGAIASVFVD